MSLNQAKLCLILFTLLLNHCPTSISHPANAGLIQNGCCVMQRAPKLATELIHLNPSVLKQQSRNLVLFVTTFHIFKEGMSQHVLILPLDKHAYPSIFFSWERKHVHTNSQKICLLFPSSNLTNSSSTLFSFQMAILVDILSLMDFVQTELKWILKGPLIVNYLPF